MIVAGDWQGAGRESWGPSSQPCAFPFNLKIGNYLRPLTLVIFWSFLKDRGMKSKGARARRNVHPGEGALSATLKQLEEPRHHPSKTGSSARNASCSSFLGTVLLATSGARAWGGKAPQPRGSVPPLPVNCHVGSAPRWTSLSACSRSSPSSLLQGDWLAELLPECQAPPPPLSCFQQWHLDLGLAPVSFPGWLGPWQRRAEEQLGKPRWQVVAAPGAGPTGSDFSCSAALGWSESRGQHRAPPRGS